VRDLHQAWSDAAGWLSLPLRVSLFLAVVVVVVTRVLPPVVGWSGRAVAAAAVPLMLLLTLPEYLTTSLCRRLGTRLLPGTFAYGAILGAAADGLQAGGRLLARVGDRRPGLPRRGLLAVASVLFFVWYSQNWGAAPPAEQRIQPARTQLVRLDTWLSTGRWDTASPACRPPAEVTPTKAKDGTRARRKHR
jgi:hypothetical protein